MESGDLWDEIFERNPQGMHPLRAKHIMAQLVSPILNSLLISAYEVLQVLFGLNEMHKVGLLHHDIKPHNVLLDSNGRMFFVDFVVSHIFENTPPEYDSLIPEERTCDMTGGMCGTVGY